MALAILVWVSIVNYVKHDAEVTETTGVTAVAPTMEAIQMEAIQDAIINNVPPQPEIFLSVPANIGVGADVVNPLSSKP